MKSRTKIGLGVALAVMLGVLIYAARAREAPSSRDANTADAESSAPSGPIAAKQEGDAAAPMVPVEASTRALVSAKWGAGLGELGRDKPQEGNPEGPMSLAATGDGLVVLDQVNGRVLKYDDRGRLERASNVPPTTQDIAVARDGSIAALDRLAEKKVTLLDRNGRKIGELPLDGDKVGETGLVTGVFVDGKDVYVEKEHGALAHVGTMSGLPADPGKELSGRPSRDGTLLLGAGLVAAREGRVVLNAFDRKLGQLRFARQISFARPSSAIVLLDSDVRGTIYLGVSGGVPEVAHIACLDPGDGHVISRIVLPLSEGPEESFRDFSVDDDGSILFAVRSDQGVEYRSARCN